jgi:hypothetical protein
MISSLLSQAGSGVGGGIAGGLVAVVGFLILAFAALFIITGIGLMKLRGWGRIIQIILAALGILNTLRGITTVFRSGSAPMVITIVILAYDIWVIWYLLTPGVKAAFGGQPAPAAAA